jgi:hypothetical protein
MRRRSYLKYLGFDTMVPLVAKRKLDSFHIRVTRVGDENGDYSFYSFYDIEARDYHDAEREARKRFCADFGAPYNKTEAYTFNKQPS